MMINSFWALLVFLLLLKSATCASSILCGRTKGVELGGEGGTSSALALALVRPRLVDDGLSVSCKLRITAPNATAFTVRLIDVKESFGELDRQLASDLQIGSPILNALTSGTGVGLKKWSARSGSPAQETDPEPVQPVPNKTESCTLSFYIGEAKQPVWKLALCSGSTAMLAAKAGSRLLPPRLRIVWNPPNTPYHHTERLRLVITAVNSGMICNEESQFDCGPTGLCISTTLTCDGVWHCPGGEDEDPGFCSKRPEPPLIDLLRRLAARNPEILGVNSADVPVHNLPTNVKVTVTESARKTNPLQDISAALKPYGAWGYLVLGMLLCATCLMFCLAWECCCKSNKPQPPPAIPASCLDPSPTMLISATQSSGLAPAMSTTPPAYEPPPSYSSLFPRAFKSSPTPVPHCSHQEPPD